MIVLAIRCIVIVALTTFLLVAVWLAWIEKVADVRASHQAKGLEPLPLKKLEIPVDENVNEKIGCRPELVC